MKPNVNRAYGTRILEMGMIIVEGESRRARGQGS